MRRVAHIDALGPKLPHYVFRAEAVPYGTDPLGAHGLAQVLDELLDQRLRPLDAVVLGPAGEVEVGGPVQRDRVSKEHVGHVGEVPIGGELVGDQLGVHEAVADDVGDDQDGDRRVRGRRVGDVGFRWAMVSFDEMVVDLGGLNISKIVDRIWSKARERSIGKCVRLR